MKIFYLFIFLIFNSKVFANDITKFAVEDFQIGSKITDYFSLKFIASNNLDNYFDTFDDKNKFMVIAITEKKYIRDWDQMEIYFKSSDYRIHAITAGNFYKNINQCYKDMEDYENIIFSSYPSSIKSGPLTTKHYADPSNLSIYKHTDYHLDNGTIGVHCYDWSSDMTNRLNWNDNLQLQVRSNELNDYIGYTD